MARGRKKSPLPPLWGEAVAAYEKGEHTDVVAGMLDMTDKAFYCRYKRWCAETGRKAERIRPKARRKPAPRPAKESEVAKWQDAFPPYPKKKKPTMKYYLSDEGMKEFLKEGSGLAMEVKDCAKHGMDFQEVENLRKKLRLKCKDFIRLIKIAKELI